MLSDRHTHLLISLFAVLFALPGGSSGGVGDSVATMNGLYGEPIDTVVSGDTTMRAYHAKGFLVNAFFRNDVCVMVCYAKRANGDAESLTEIEVKRFLATNDPDAKGWKLTGEAPSIWIRGDEKVRAVFHFGRLDVLLVSKKLKAIDSRPGHLGDAIQ